MFGCNNFGQIGQCLDHTENDIKGLECRFLTLEEVVEHMRLEQIKMIQMAATRTISDVDQIKDRLGLAT